MSRHSLLDSRRETHSRIKHTTSPFVDEISIDPKTTTEEMSTPHQTTYTKSSLSGLTIHGIRNIMKERGYRLPPTSYRKGQQIDWFLQYQNEESTQPRVSNTVLPVGNNLGGARREISGLQWPSVRQRRKVQPFRQLESFEGAPANTIFTIEELQALGPTYDQLYRLGTERHYEDVWILRKFSQRDDLYRDFIDIQLMNLAREKEITTLDQLADFLTGPLVIGRRRPLSDKPFPEAGLRDFDELRSNLFSGNRFVTTTGVYIYPIEEVVTLPEETIERLAERSIYSHFVGSIDDMVAMIWWSYMKKYVGRSYSIGWKVREAVSTGDREQLLSLFPVDYPFATDKASLVYAALEGIVIPIEDLDTAAQQRYRFLSTLPYQTSMLLAKYLYDYFTADDGKPSWYTPMRFVARQRDISPLEPFILAYRPGSVDRLGQHLGMVFPQDVDQDEYFLENLRFHRAILSRGAILPPPRVDGQRVDWILEQLDQYTDAELLQAYDIGEKTWKSRPELLRLIAEWGSGGSVWSFRSNRCRNDDRLDVVEYEPRVKNDPSNPILSYGTLMNYRCYTMEELLFVFREDPELGFKFAVPDFVRGDDLESFPDQSIIQLRDMLVEHRQNRGDLFNRLIEVIDRGLAINARGRVFTRRLNHEYRNMSTRDQDLVREYLAWLFTTGMWFRAWHGPGSPYPVMWDEGIAMGEEARTPNQCTPTQRNRNAILQFQRRASLLDSMSADLERWVLSLPRVRYDFRTMEARFGVEPINRLVELVQLGTFCILDASDQLIQTGYYFAKEILGLDSAQAFNQFLDGTSAFQGVQQPPFDPSRYRRTGHVEFIHRLELQEE